MYDADKCQQSRVLMENDKDALLASKSNIFKTKPYHEKHIQHEFLLESPISIYKTARYDAKWTMDEDYYRLDSSPAAHHNAPNPRLYYDRRIVLV